MGAFGCLFILLFLVFIIGISLVGKSLEMIGATVVWIWESFCNIFRTAKKEVRNPWTGTSNFETEDQARAEKKAKEEQKTQNNPDGTRPKMYEKSDGDYIDYTEL